MQATLPILHFWKKKYLGNHFKRIPFKHNLLCSFPSIPWFLHRRVRVSSADSSHENKHSPPGQRSTQTVDVLCFKTCRIPRKIHTELWISDGFWDRGCSLTAQMKTAAGAAELQAGVKVECWRLIFPSFIFPQPPPLQLITTHLHVFGLWLREPCHANTTRAKGHHLSHACYNWQLLFVSWWFLNKCAQSCEFRTKQPRRYNCLTSSCGSVFFVPQASKTPRKIFLFFFTPSKTGECNFSLVSKVRQRVLLSPHHAD